MIARVTSERQRLLSLRNKFGITYLLACNGRVRSLVSSLNLHSIAMVTNPTTNPKFSVSRILSRRKANINLNHDSVWLLQDQNLSRTTRGLKRQVRRKRPPQAMSQWHSCGSFDDSRCRSSSWSPMVYLRSCSSARLPTRLSFKHARRFQQALQSNCPLTISHRSYVSYNGTSEGAAQAEQGTIGKYRAEALQ
ncbi:hypothetical protein DL98DRAFT_26172 [Cadophora sp. DSE1049]|nr:hypothetical protein DL98DRAFT_26172 [Cadophora sp. DSE1049]